MQPACRAREAARGLTVAEAKGKVPGASQGLLPLPLPRCDGGSPRVGCRLPLVWVMRGRGCGRARAGRAPRAAPARRAALRCPPVRERAGSTHSAPGRRPGLSLTAALSYPPAKQRLGRRDLLRCASSAHGAEPPAAHSAECVQPRYLPHASVAQPLLAARHSPSQPCSVDHRPNPPHTCACMHLSTPPNTPPPDDPPPPSLPTRPAPSRILPTLLKILVMICVSFSYFSSPTWGRLSTTAKQK